MNELQDVPPHVVNPPAIVQAVFDEQRAFEEVRAAIAQRDDAKGEFKSATLVIGQKLLEVRRALPGAVARPGVEKWSPAFKAFVERCGLSEHTARVYMGYARDPKRLEQQKQRSAGRSAKMALKIRTAIRNGATLDELDQALTEIIGD